LQRTVAELCSAGQARAPVPTWFVVEFRFGLSPKIATYWTGEGACPYVVRGGIQVLAEPKDCLLDRRGRLSLRGSWWNSGFGIKPENST
jgi:hypothetical protein